MESTHNFLLTNTNLKNITNQEWSNLARYYAKTNAVLIPRALYKGYIDEKEEYIVDDWLLGPETLMLFYVMDTKPTNTVDSMVGKWVSQKDMGKTLNYPDHEILSWNPETFSWSIISEGMTNTDQVFIERGINTEKPHTVFLDVPFGHVVRNCDIRENSPRYYVSHFPTLGEFGRKYSTENGPPFVNRIFS